MAASRRYDNYTRRTVSADGRRLTNTYIDGNVVRRVQEMPQQQQERQRRQRRSASINAKRNREKALRMNMPYVVFLAAASIASVFVCINFLQLQSQGINYRNEIAALESRLSMMRLANDNAYENAISTVNMEEVKDIAINQLGMVYANEGQVITYSSQEGDYIRQYGEIPTE